MKELDLIENKDIREKMIGNVSVLEKVKDLLLLGDSEFATTQQVADYYEVGLEAVKSITKRHKEELETNGLTLLKGEALKSFKGQVQDEPSIKFVSQLTLFSKRTILNIGMLLTEGDVAKEVRSRLLDIEYESNKAVQKMDKL